MVDGFAGSHRSRNRRRLLPMIVVAGGLSLLGQQLWSEAWVEPFASSPGALAAGISENKGNSRVQRKILQKSFLSNEFRSPTQTLTWPIDQSSEERDFPFANSRGAASGPLSFRGRLLRAVEQEIGQRLIESKAGYERLKGLRANALSEQPEALEDIAEKLVIIKQRIREKEEHMRRLLQVQLMEASR
jgi:hypothetical protein